MRHSLSSHRKSHATGIFEWIIHALLACLLTFTAMAGGGTFAWSQEIVLALSTILGICLMVKSWVEPDSRFVWGWAYIPITMFCLLAAVQLMPLPAALLHAIAPATFNLRASLLGDLPDADAILRHQTLTLYPFATAGNLRLLLAVSLVFIVVLNVYQSHDSIERLLLAVTLIGLGETGVALYRILTGEGTIFGVWVTTAPNTGTFANHSHYSQFMNLATGAALGLMLVELARYRDRYGRLSRAMDELFNPRAWRLWAATALCLIGPVTVFLSTSRMGMISLLVSAAVIAALSAWKGAIRGAGTTLAIIGMAVLLLLLAIGFDSVYQRIATLQNASAGDEGRVHMLRDMTQAFRKFPLFGTGLGSHEFVFPMFDTAMDNVTYTYAEDDYAQLFEEAGAVGALLALAFVVWLASRAYRALAHTARPSDYAAFGVLLGILAILIHSASDFGQHVPANALLTATLAALLCNLGRVSRAAHRDTAVQSAPHHQRLLATGFVAIFVVAIASTLGNADLARRAEALAAIADEQWQFMQNTHREKDVSLYVGLLDPLSHAVSLAPGNIHYRYDLNEDRYHAVIYSDMPADGIVRWDQTKQTYARLILDQLLTARQTCPTFGPAVALQGQIEYFALGEKEAGIAHIRQAQLLKPFDRNISFVSGCIAVEQNDWTRAANAFDRSLQLGLRRTDVVDVYVAAKRADLAHAIATNDRDALIDLAHRLANDPAQSSLAAQCTAEANTLMLDESKQADAGPALLAAAAALQAERGNLSDAIVLYKRALTMDFGNSTWRLDLARCLLAAGKSDEAIQQAQTVRDLSPGNNEAASLIDQALSKGATTRRVAPN